MNSAPEGWYVDPSTGTNLRFWSGSTWTDEVAPLPYEPTHSGPVDLFADATAGRSEPALVLSDPADLSGADGTSLESSPCELEPEIELTRLTRRELRARRGGEVALDDAPRHLPPMSLPAAVSIEYWIDEVEEVETPAPLETEEPYQEADGARYWRAIIRWSVLLAVLLVGTSTALLVAAPG